MPITPMKIRTLQRKLYAKAKQEPGYRFYALNDKVFRADLLQHAWRLVKSNKGAPGIDGVSFADIEAEEGVEQFLAELAAEVRVIPASGGGSLEESACLDMKHIGKPCTGERYARFDEGGQGHLSPTLRFGLAVWSFTRQRRQTYDDEQVSVLMLMIAERRVGKRPRRLEPRAVKRRPKAMPLLTKPRQVARAQVERYGHPKRLK